MSSTPPSSFPGTAVAVIGMAGRFPNAADVDEFWANLRDGVDGMTWFTDDELREAGVPEEHINDPNYVKGRCCLREVDRFDPSFWNYTVKQAQVMDPQIRVFLETCWQALESAGYFAGGYEGSIGVYGGASPPTYLLYHMLRDYKLVAGTSAWSRMIYTNNDYLTTHASYRIGLRGPSVNVQSACSTSLVAVHQAVQAVLAGECSIALAGGVSIWAPTTRGYLYEDGHILSPDGRCRAFDAEAQGTVEGEGVGVVVLKRLDQALEDGDPVHAVILSTAVNNDGGLKVGYTAPSIDGQADVITEAQAVAGITPDDLQLIEAHGTGTSLGDPIEITALKQVFHAAGTERRGFCAIGAAKSAIGHLDAAAGVAGLIKTVLSLKHRQIPPVLHFSRPNPRLELEGSPFFINDRLRDWEVPEGTPRRAGVSSFGIGGTNAHAILQEAPAPQPSGPARPWQLLILSHMTEKGREEMTQNFVRWLEANPGANMADVAFTLQAGRSFFRQRRVLLCRDRDDALQALQTMDPTRVKTKTDPHIMTPLVLMFPGQGAQYVGMARELYEVEPIFREVFDECREILRPHLGGVDLRDVVHPAEGATEEASERLRQTAFTQPALFVVEYSLARLLRHWGYVAESMIGHSIGEYVAACLAGVFSLEDALRLVAERGKLMQEMPHGSMLSVSLTEAALAEILPDSLDLAAINGPEVCVVAGPHEAVDAFQAELEARSIRCQRLHTSHAFHSRMMDPIVARFEEIVRSVDRHPPLISYVSNVTGDWVTEQEATDPAYWARHLRGTVRFDDGLRLLMREPERNLLEVGPGRSLATLARRHPARQPQEMVLTTMPHAHDDLTDTQVLWDSVGELWMQGLEPKWPRFYDGQRRHRVPLPTYPFQRGRFQLGLKDEEAEKTVTFWSPETQHMPVPQHFDPRNEYEEIMVDIFREIFGLETVSIYHNFFHLGGDSLLAVQLVSRIRERCRVEIPLRRLWELRTVAQYALLVSEYVQKQGEQQVALRADREAVPVYAGEVDLGMDALSDAEVEAMLAELGEGTEQVV
ncbi:MAG TPA: beta-ketoacyl synthase N-terminal-like domain-containing protein [Longimicrobium sp.]|nr:beta-ketoacyl synthase N-terminal-like domain-containing protein [Longimicrobium sp.]